MLSCPQHHHPSLHLRLRCHYNHRKNPNFSTTLPFSSSSTITISSSLHHQHQQPPSPPKNSPITTTSTPSPTDEPILRTHNSKSTTFLLHHLKQSNQLQNTISQEDKLQDAISPEEKVKLLEMTLVTRKRIPRFPGSISPQLSAKSDSPLQTLFRNGNEDIEDDNGEEEEDEDEEMIMKALEIRRKVTAEIFKEAMRRKGKFGITYSTNLVDRLSDFIDFIMIEAAALKKLPEFQYSSFNVRAKTVIQDLNVVPLIRYIEM